jgi:outer membrane protein OmpA-like peptidoglycan-associated protein
MNLRSRLVLGAAALTGAAMFLFCPQARAAEPAEPAAGAASTREFEPWHAGQLTLSIEPGLAIPLTSPQSDLFKLGGGQTVKGLWSLTRYLDVGPSVTFIALPNKPALGEFGTVWGLGAGARLKRPHTPPGDDTLRAISPWVDADLLYIRTGSLNRAGYSVGAGASFPLGATRTFWLGPFVRYLQVLQADKAGFDGRDAKILSVGLSLEIGPGFERLPPPPTPAPAAEVRTVTKEVFSCPDRDQDGIPDAIDACPDVAGPMENRGCPAYKRLVVGPEKLELKEKLFFHWNEARLEDASYPALDEVAQALKDNPRFRVQVEGHASSEGGEAHNQDLSERRAEAVLDYLATHGVAKERLVSKGFSSSVPAATNTTEAGREKNRRVEFVVNFIILNDGSK